MQVRKALAILRVRVHVWRGGLRAYRWIGVTHAVAYAAKARAGGHHGFQHGGHVIAELQIGVADDGCCDFRVAPAGRVVDHGLDQHRDHDPEHARSGHDAAQNAALCLGASRHRVLAASVIAGSCWRDHNVANRPQFRHDLL